MNETVKAVMSVAFVMGVFALCGLGVYKGEMSTTAAVATSMASLTSAGVFASLFGKKAEDAS